MLFQESFVLNPAKPQTVCGLVGMRKDIRHRVGVYKA